MRQGRRDGLGFWMRVALALLLGAALGFGGLKSMAAASIPTDNTPDWTAEGNQYTSTFGRSVAKAGDVNGDGYDDVIVGAPWYEGDQTLEGHAFLYLGSAGGLDATPSWTGEGNKDSALLGECVAGAGDVNGDGFDDVVVGAPEYTNGQAREGRAFLYLGSAAGLATSPAWTAESDNAEAHFGTCVAGAGDVNGDGFGDVVIGASRYTNGQTREGRAYLYLGSAAGLAATPAWTAESDNAEAQFGVRVAGAGDVNGDGKADVVVGASGFTNGQNQEGRVYLYLGSAAGLAATPAWTAEGDKENARLGLGVAGVGDVNGDGFDDVVAGAPSYTTVVNNEGRAYLYLGSAAGLSATPAWTTDGRQGENLGLCVAGAGDVNGDGKADVIVGAPELGSYDTINEWVYLHNGTTGGLTAAPTWAAQCDKADCKFGNSVAGAGDVNGDGFDDLIVAAIDYTHDLFQEGRVFLYLGSTTVPVELSGFAVE